MSSRLPAQSLPASGRQCTSLQTVDWRCLVLRPPTITGSKTGLVILSAAKDPRFRAYSLERTDPSSFLLRMTKHSYVERSFRDGALSSRHRQCCRRCRTHSGRGRESAATRKTSDKASAEAFEHASTWWTPDVCNFSSFGYRPYSKPDWWHEARTVRRGVRASLLDLPRFTSPPSCSRDIQMPSTLARGPDQHARNHRCLVAVRSCDADRRPMAGMFYPPSITGTEWRGLKVRNIQNRDVCTDVSPIGTSRPGRHPGSGRQANAVFQ